MNVSRHSVTGIFTAVLGAVVCLAAVPSASHAQHGASGHITKPMAGAATMTAGGLMKNVDKHMAMLSQSIKVKKLSVVHEHAFAVRDAVKMLPARSKSLSAASQARLAIGVKTISSLATELDEAGDAGREDETEALYKKFSTVIGAIKKLYPASALKS